MTVAVRPGVRIVINRANEVGDAIKALVGSHVLIGIPEKNNPRDDGDSLGNAARGYIHEFGAPEAGIPPRPFLIPGVAIGLTPAMAYMEQGAKKALAGDLKAVGRALEAAGLVASGAVKTKINVGPFVPLAPATIAARRRRSKGSKYRRKATTAADTKPLVDTGEMRGKVTYVVEKK